MTKPFTDFEVYKKSIILAKEIFILMNTQTLRGNMALKIRLNGRLFRSVTILLRDLSIIITNSLLDFYVIPKVVVQK